MENPKSCQEIEDIIDFISEFRKIKYRFVEAMIKRGVKPDTSKLEEPEFSYFKRIVSLLKTREFGSPEYQQDLSDLGPALEHHYKNNRHHPEHFENGVMDMTLVDILEMFADWIASSQRSKEGDARESITRCCERYGIDLQLKFIFINTLNALNEGKL